MILYGLLGTLILYTLLLLVSVIYLGTKKSSREVLPVSFALPVDPPHFPLFSGKVKLSRYITRYKCPECGYSSHDHEKYCPRCLENGKHIAMNAFTLPSDEK